MKARINIEAYKACLAHVYSLTETGSRSFEELRSRSPKYTIWQVRRSVKDLAAAGKITTDGKRPSLYFRTGVEPKEGKPCPQFVRVFKPLQRDPFELWKLCDRAPFDLARDVVVLVR